MTKKNIKLPHDHGVQTYEALEKMPEDGEFADASAVFGLISDATRLEILWLLCHSEDCVMNIAAAVEMSSPAVSHHLRLLKQSKLISSRKEGKEVYYRLADTADARLMHGIIDAAFERKSKENK